MAIPFCYLVLWLSVMEEGENCVHVNKVLGEVADHGLWIGTSSHQGGKPARDTVAHRLCLEGSKSH